MIWKDHKFWTSCASWDLQWRIYNIRSPFILANFKCYSDHKKRKGNLPLYKNYQGILLSAIAAKVYNKMILNKFIPAMDPLYSGMWLANFEKEGNWARGPGTAEGPQSGSREELRRFWSIKYPKTPLRCPEIYN